MGMCEVLGCLPSELHEKYPNMTVADKSALIKYALLKNVRLANAIGRLFSGGSTSGRAFGGKR